MTTQAKWSLTIIAAALLAVGAFFAITWQGIICGVAVNEVSAIKTLRAFNSANLEFAKGHNGSTATKLVDLSGLLAPDLLTTQRNGYRFRYVPGTPTQKGIVGTYQIFAEPIDRKSDHYFFTDQTEVIRYGIGRVNVQSEALH